MVLGKKTIVLGKKLSCWEKNYRVGKKTIGLGSHRKKIRTEKESFFMDGIVKAVYLSNDDI